MAANCGISEQENEGRCSNQLEGVPGLMPTTGHHDQSSKADELDQQTPPPPPPPPPHISVPAYMPMGPSVHGQQSPRRRQKELQFELVQALEREDKPALLHLINEGTHLSCIIMFNKTPLTYAIEKENFAVAELLVESGASVNYREPYANAQQPLHVAVNVGSMDMIGFLLRQGADVNGRNGCGLTPLMLACYSGQQEAVELLHTHGADLQAVDSVGKTALHWAAEGQHCSLVQFLLTNGADVNAVDSCGRTALYHSIIFHHMDVIKLLLNAGISVNGSDVFHQSPLMVAVQRISKPNVRGVLSTSLDYHHRTKRIPTTELRRLLNRNENEATVRVDFEILQLLVNAGAMLNLSGLGDQFGSLFSHISDDDLKIGLWYYLIVCDCVTSLDCCVMGPRMSPSVLETWMEEKKNASLQQLCRCAVRRRLSRRRPCDITSAVNRLPIPNPQKSFLSMSDFFKRYPQFLPLCPSSD